MPIETDSEAWQSAKASDSEGEAILKHLKENPSKAFSARDITKIFYDVDIDNIDLPDDAEETEEIVLKTSIKATNKWVLNSRIQTHLEELSSSDSVARKAIPNERLSHIDADEGETIFYSAE